MSEQTYGVTPPISVTLPTESEKRSNDALLRELRAQGTFESPTETAKREEVLKSLEVIADAFVKKAAEKAHPQNAILIRDARGRIFTYGSYRLGVYGPGSDIDTLVVAPKYVTVEHYFEFFPDLLMAMTPPGAITDLTAVKEAFVPIIKFEYWGISIDLIFCSIQTQMQLPDRREEWSLADNNLLRGLSENEVRSLNGTRVTDEILTLVPEKATFKLALRAIKLWAQRKAIYANIIGYPGGVAWAMMVARVCQLYPKATSALVVNKFFHIMLKWPWPLPVLLKDIEYGSAVTRVAVWNPKVQPTDRNHKMPIITPSYPSMCATHNVGMSSMAVIKKELDLGARLTDEILVGRRPWKDLFAKHTFFTSDFRYYLTVVSCSKTKEAQNAFSGLIESRVRFLVGKIEVHPSIALARAFNKGYDRVHRCKNDSEIEEVQSGSLAYMISETEVTTNGATKSEVKSEANQEAKSEPGVPVVKTEPTEETNLGAAAVVKEEEGDTKNIKLEDVAETHTETILYTTNHYIGLQLAVGAKSLDLSREVNEWKFMCLDPKRNPLYDPHIHSLTIQQIRNFALPDDVFEKGEVKPVKAVKKKRLPEEDASNSAGKRQRTTAAVA
ncbi:Poly(A) polymerase central domain-containing protein [Apodospora peruviana]|uniref:Poly(A) polymerase n=1 Tax=Apodospora peruviana TaxID=516989 RepID=A0AAE0ICL2_9PEZI|nr:Poly(A) polymerase central domain-containing protein [Apodospora peruviana]